MNNKKLLNIPFVSGEKISNITTYKTQGTVKGVFYPRNEKELILVYKFLKEIDIPFKVIGNGSNLLIKNNVDLLFICTKNMKDYIRINGNDVFVSAGTNLSKVFRTTSEKGLSGFENLAGIPATIGGAIKMNASAFGQSIFDNVEKIKIFQNGKIRHLKKIDIIYSHHKTNLNNCLVLSAKFKLKSQKRCEILNNFGKFAKSRCEKQPKGFSCGSVFQNPSNISAGQLIENCGLKGIQKSNAIISQKHGNFIINQGDATFEDVKYLINLCQKEAIAQYNIPLECEVEIIE